MFVERTRAREKEGACARELHVRECSDRSETRVVCPHRVRVFCFFCFYDFVAYNINNGMSAHRKHESDAQSPRTHTYKHSPHTPSVCVFVFIDRERVYERVGF